MIHKVYDGKRILDSEYKKVKNFFRDSNRITQIRNGIINKEDFDEDKCYHIFIFNDRESKIIESDSMQVIPKYSD